MKHKSWSLKCRIFGHKYQPFASDSKGWFIVKCKRCGATANWSPETHCAEFGHKFSEGHCLVCEKTLNKEKCKHSFIVVGVDHFHEREHVSITYTQRHYRCVFCDKVRSDFNKSQFLRGTWELQGKDHLVPVNLSEEKEEYKP